MNSKRQNILCVGFPSWEGDYMKSTVLLMKELAKFNNVIYAEYHFTFKDLLYGIFRINKNVPVLRMLGIKKRARKIRVSGRHFLHVLTLPPSIPVNWVNNPIIYEALNYINALLAKWVIRKAQRKLNQIKPIVINAFSPALGNGLLKAFDEKAVIYYCYDQISHAKWAKKHGQNQEWKFIHLVDAVIVSSEELYKAKSQINKNCYLVKNGVDYNLFSKSLEIKKKIIKTKHTKTVGYLGSIDDRLDYELIKYLAKKLPSIHFKFVGRIVDFKVHQELEMLSNVSFTGPKNPQEIQYELATFDIGIIPFIKNEFTRNIYPLKINEYLAAGLPVVTTDFAPLNEFESLISISSEPGIFLEHLEQELNNGHHFKQEERRNHALKNSWQSRADQFNLAMKAII